MVEGIKICQVSGKDKIEYHFIVCHHFTFVLNRYFAHSCCGAWKKKLNHNCQRRLGNHCYMNFNDNRSLIHVELRDQIYVELLSLDVIEPSKETVLLAQLIEVHTKCNVSLVSLRVMISWSNLCVVVFRWSMWSNVICHLFRGFFITTCTKLVCCSLMALRKTKRWR